MEVYNQIKKDLRSVIIFIWIMLIIANSFDLFTDDTDKNGWNRSGFQLLTDYGTGKQYLYKNGVIIERK
jgi:hypothetical protein